MGREHLYWGGLRSRQVQGELASEVVEKSVVEAGPGGTGLGNDMACHMGVLRENAVSRSRTTQE